MLPASLNPAQQQVIDHGLLTSGFSCILQMPTSSGKTWLAKQAIVHSVQAGFRAVYITPLRALAAELVNEWAKDFAGIQVGIFTGDYGQGGRAFPVPYSDARVLITTPERLDVCTRNWRSHWDWIPEIDLVVIDEVHLLGDRGRGARLEGTVSRLRRLNPFCRVLGLSATLGNREELADWLGGVEFGSEWRPVPLSWRISRFRTADEKPAVLLRESLNAVKKGGQSLVFVQSRRRSEMLSQFLCDQGLRADYHHAGLGQGDRRRIEQSFRARATQVLVATGTLEMGLNLPARQVVLYDLQAFDGSGFSPLTTNTVWQRAGRAGRPGLDESGEVVLMTPAWDHNAQCYPIGRFERIESGMSDRVAIAEQILVEVQSGLARSSVQLERVFDSSLANLQGRRPPLDETIGEMLRARMLSKDEREEEEIGEERLRVTPLGRVTVRHLLRPATILSLREFLLQEPKFTHFDLLVAAACTDDCEPMFPVDFEELELLTDRLSRLRSHLFQRAHADWRLLIPSRGKRVLSALKAAVVLLHWTEAGDAEAVAAEHDCYPFELLRLCESMDRLLLAALAIDKLVHPPASNSSGEHVDNEPVSSRIKLLRQMVLNGVDEHAAELTLIDGIGAKWSRTLVNAGIAGLGSLTTSTPEHLRKIDGLSEKRARAWVDSARELVDIHSSKGTHYSAPFVRTKPAGLELNVDHYRLRRAFELKVECAGTRSWNVTGGLEPHRVVGEHADLSCDCHDHAKGHVCKHMLAVRLHCEDAKLRTATDRMAEVSDEEHLDLFSLWFERS
jgi:ATP-dependent DNA helicase